MPLFGKRNENKATAEDLRSGNLSPQNTGKARVAVLGSGCAKCNALEAAAKAAMEELGLEPAIDHVRDFAQIASYGVMSTPALVVDGKVVSTGRVLSKDDVLELLKQAQA